MALLEFDLTPSGTPTVRAIDRTGQFPVLSSAITAQLLTVSYRADTRVWELTLALTNHTPLTAYGAWVEFFNLNGNTILNPDGFATLNNGGDEIWWPGAGQLKPVIAFGEAQAFRPWPGGSTLVRTIDIRWPAGTDSFNGMQAYVDIAYPGPRQQPIVEHPTLLRCAGTTPNGGCASLITAAVLDWQTPAQRLPVVALVETNGQQVSLPMSDDGRGGDQIADDHIYTGVLPFDPVGVTPYVAVLAGDTEGYHFLNGLVLGPGQ